MWDLEVFHYETDKKIYWPRGSIGFLNRGVLALSWEERSTQTMAELWPRCSGCCCRRQISLDVLHLLSDLYFLSFCVRPALPLTLLFDMLVTLNRHPKGGVKRMCVHITYSKVGQTFVFLSLSATRAKSYSQCSSLQVSRGTTNSHFDQNLYTIFSHTCVQIES